MPTSDALLLETFEELKRILCTETIWMIKDTPADAIYRLHFGVGTYIRNMYLYPKKPLYYYFLQHAMVSEDNMPAAFLKEFHSYLNNSI